MGVWEINVKARPRLAERLRMLNTPVHNTIQSVGKQYEDDDVMDSEYMLQRRLLFLKKRRTKMDVSARGSREEKEFSMEKFGGKKAELYVQNSYNAFLKKISELLGDSSEFRVLDVALWIYNCCNEDRNDEKPYRTNEDDGFPINKISDENQQRKYIIKKAKKAIVDVYGSDLFRNHSDFDKIFTLYTDLAQYEVSDKQASILALNQNTELGTAYGQDQGFVLPFKQRMVKDSKDQMNSSENNIKPSMDNLFQNTQHLLSNEVTENEMPTSEYAEILWLKSESRKCLERNPSLGLQELEMSSKILNLLETDENALPDLIGYDNITFVTDLIARKGDLLGQWNKLKENRGSSTRSTNTSGRRDYSHLQGSSFKVITKKKGNNKNKDKGSDPLQLLASVTSEETSANERTFGAGSSLGFTQKKCFPAGTRHLNLKDYRATLLPPPEVVKKDESHLIRIADLPDWAQDAFKGTKSLNIVQSRVFKQAYRNESNLLVCAPTGAGKTNIALLCVLRVIHSKMSEGKLDLFGNQSKGKGKGKGKKGGNLENNDQRPSVFKIVYIAPMKALCAEVVEKFSRALEYLGIIVREYTGDMQLTKQEFERTHIIVTVPEKWDVITRNSGSAGDEHNIQRLIELVIIDEVHLLNDSRGAVIEAIVARLFRFKEVTMLPMRLVALSATLPSYKDVGQFLRVPSQNIFHFDGGYRPIPLQQTFIGIKQQSHSKGIDAAKRKEKQNEICFERILEVVREGHQCMIFVHARMDTVRTAKKMIEIAHAKDEVKQFSCKHICPQFSEYCKEIKRAKSSEISELFQHGFGIHHAGLLRSDRSLSEKLFRNNAIKVLCCTSTLAWGVNLPARAVVVKGTQVYDASKGGFTDIGILDIMQIFGRAGRPGLDTLGIATLITDEEKLDHYLRLLLEQTPIKSRFLEEMNNSLNAEVAMGNINTMKDAVTWMKYTYFYIRLFKEKLAFGISSAMLQEDPRLEKKRLDLVEKAADKLDAARMIRVDPTGALNSTDLGRVAAKYYLDWETADHFCKSLNPNTTHSEILKIFGEAHEFRQLKIRDEEGGELSRLKQDKNVCHVKVLGSPDEIHGKVSILLQAYLSRAFVETHSLVSDANYILQNANRLFRAMFEITLTRVAGLSQMSEQLLEWAKMVNNRMWHWHHMLRHFCHAPPSPQKQKTIYTNKKDKNSGGVLKENSCMKLEHKRVDFWNLLDYEQGEIKSIVGETREANIICKYRWKVPYLDIEHQIVPVTSTIMRIKLIVKLNENCIWTDNWSGTFEPFLIWVSNPDNSDILHSEPWILTKKNAWNENIISFVIPLSNEHPPQYQIVFLSERWVNLKFTAEFSINHYIIPSARQQHTPLLDLFPLPVTALQNKNYQQLYKFTHFNAIQTQVFHTLMHTDYNALIGAPTGSGKTIISELAIFRLLNSDITRNNNNKIIYIAPLKALAKERMDDWTVRFGKILGKKVIELTGDFTPDVQSLDDAQIIITTPEKWDGISRHWQHRAYVRRVGLVIIDEIHLLGQDRGPVLEVIVSRMRYISANIDIPIRFVGLSTALANAHDIADWLGIGMIGLFNFKPSVRPVPMTIHIQGFPEKNFCPRMATMNRPCYQAIRHHSPNKPTLIFVSSRRQTRLTGLDLMALIANDDTIDPYHFRRFDPQDDTAYNPHQIKDVNLAQFMEYGIGMHHAGLHADDRALVEKFYLEGKIMILIATSTLAWGVNFPAHLVIIKGTEYFDGATKKYVDFPITDVLQMMGRAGRPQFDKQAVAVVMVHEPKKNFYKRFIYEPFPVESSLHEQLTDHLNAEVNAKTITNKAEAIDYVTWTYFFRRLTANPSYYDPQVALQNEGAEDASFSAHAKSSGLRGGQLTRGLTAYLERLMDRCLTDLVRCKCIKLRDGGQDPETGHFLPPIIEPLHLGKISSLYYMGHRTVFEFFNILRKNCDEGLSFVEIMNVICNCPEYREVPVRHNEDKLNAEFSEKCPIGLDLSTQTFESPHTKAFLLLQAHLFQLELPITDYKTDLKSVLDRTIPIIQALVDIATEEAQWRTCLNLILLLQCLHQATHPWRSSLYCLPLPKQIIRTLKLSYNIDSIAQLSDQDDSFIYQTIADSFSANEKFFHTEMKLPMEKQRDMLQKVVAICKDLPKLRVWFQLYQIEEIEEEQDWEIDEFEQETKQRDEFKEAEAKFGDEKRLEKNKQENILFEEKEANSSPNATGPWDTVPAVKCKPIAIIEQPEASAENYRKPVTPPPSDNNPRKMPNKKRISLQKEYDGMTTKFKVPSGANLELEIFLWYENIPMKYAYAPKFPKKKTYSWWLMLGDEENDELIANKKMLMQTINRKWQKKAIMAFEAPEEDPGEAFTLNFMCLSDSYVGLDQQYNIEIIMI